MQPRKYFPTLSLLLMLLFLIAVAVLSITLIWCIFVPDDGVGHGTGGVKYLHCNMMVAFESEQCVTSKLVGNVSNRPVRNPSHDQPRCPKMGAGKIHPQQRPQSHSIVVCRVASAMDRGLVLAIRQSLQGCCVIGNPSYLQITETPAHLHRVLKCIDFPAISQRHLLSVVMT